MEKIKILEEKVRSAVEKISQLKKENEKMSKEVAILKSYNELAKSDIKKLEIFEHKHLAVKKRIEKVLAGFDKLKV